MKKLTIFAVLCAAFAIMACHNEKKNDTCCEKADTCCASAAQAPCKDEAKKKTVIARVEVKAGQETAFLEVTKPLISGTRAEPGNISYTLYQSPNNPLEFIFYEEYKDEAAFEAHANSAHFNAFAGAIPDMLAKELIIESY